MGGSFAVYLDTDGGAVTTQAVGDTVWIQRPLY
jgi:hypothetical protein